MSLRRAGLEPLITREHLADLAPEIVDPSSVFNPGAVRAGQTDILLLRVQTRGRRTFTVPAVVNEAQKVTVAPRPTHFDWQGQEPAGPIFHIYDARITRIDGQLFVVTAVDLEGGCRLAIWRATGVPDHPFAGLDQLLFCGWSAHPDTRNGVLFPEKIHGRYAMLERPNLVAIPGAPPTGSAIVLSMSDDLVSWEDQGPVMEGHFHYWDELVGSGPPPLKTRHGWLHLYHGVATHFQAANIYQVGAVLLDLDDPRRVIARTRDNLLEPRLPWELTGQVPNVVFPGGLTVDSVDAQGFAPDTAAVRVYYGAADTAVGLATATLADLISACKES
jgi:beta-1,4-mannooligosaccharide/beta-1,4-mannosyl-N-acetylglucosamine phosphorylase|nr:glycoside hydrolase family 130 protein [Candidatus Krumholzibacteria bacterium]